MGGHSTSKTACHEPPYLHPRGVMAAPDDRGAGLMPRRPAAITQADLARDPRG